MEESAPIESDPSPVDGALASALADHASARETYDAGVASLAEAAQDDHVQAAQVIQRSIDKVSGEVANTLDTVEQKLVKSLQKVTDAAQYDHSSAINRLTTAGAAPLYVTADMVADLERDDPVQSAYEQLIAPVAAKAAGQFVVPDKGGVCPPGYTFDGTISGCVLTAPSDLPPTDPTPLPILTLPPTVPPVTPGCQPTCPPPVVYLLPPSVCEPTSPPPPTAPPPPPDCDPTDPEGGCYIPCDPTDPEGDCYLAPPEVLPPPREVPPEVAPEPKPVKPQFTPPVTPAVVPRQFAVSSWDSPGRCSTIARDLLVPIFGGGGEAVANPLAVAVAGAADKAVSALYEPLMQFAGMGIPAAFTPFSDAVGYVTSTVDQALNNLTGGASSVTVKAVGVLTLANVAEKYTGAPLPYLAMGYQYDMQYANPQFLPSQEIVDAMYIRGVIDDELWECLTRANGNHPWARRLVLGATRTPLGTGDAISLFRRGQITRDALTGFARANGVTSPTDLDAMVAAGEFVPPYTDLIRFMVRDATDPDVYVPYNYDYQFEQKFAGRIPEWAAAQGITPDVFRYLWRSHWQLPSPTQLYEMLHRLRPGRVDPTIAVTSQDVKKVLIANDMAPAFVDRLMEVSYNPITRTDILTFYTNGSMDGPEVVQRLQDTGYSEADALRIQKAWELEVANRRQNKARVWSRINIAKAYRDGGMDRADAKRLLLRSIETDREVDELLDDVDLQRKVMRVQKCIKAVRKRVITGELDELGARGALQQLGLDIGVAAEIAAGWMCEIVSMSREPLARMVLSWYRDGVIDHDETYRRLINMRYLPDAVERMLKDVEVTEARKQAAAAAAAARRDAADLRQAQRDAERSSDRAKKRKKCIDEGGDPSTC
jgi:hypothetical protein